MKTDQNSNMQGTLDKRISMKKRRNAKRALLALNLVAVIFTTTVFFNPVSVLSEEVSTDAVQSIEDNAGGDAQIADQADVQQNTAEAAQAAEAPAAENSVEAAKAEEPSGVNAPAENAMSAEMSAAEDGLVSTDDGAASAVQSADASSASNGPFEGAGAGNTDGTKDGIIENDAEGLNEAEGTAANEEAEDAASQEQLTYEDEHVKISASYTDGRAFTADSILTGTYLDSDEKNAVLSAVNTQISKGNSADTVSDTAENTESSGSAPVASTTATTVEYSVAGFHALMLATKNQDGSDTTTEGDVTFSAEFKKGLNDAGYSTREETTENNEAGGDGSLTTTTTRCETLWKIYTVTGKNLTDITDITDAHNTHYEMDENGTLKSASFRGALPQTVAFVQIVKKTVTETTTQKETEKATERETESETDTETQKAKETEKIAGTETEQATEKTTERETDDVKEQVSSSAAMPAVTFDQKVITDNGTVMVHVEAEEGAFEEGTSMTVTPVTSKAILDKAIEAAGGRGSAAAVDISFRKADGTETEPEKPIRVKMTAKVLSQADKVNVVHVDDTGNTDVVARKSDGKTIESTSSEAASSDAKNVVSFESDSFSVYAIVYTVDFTFEDFTYNMSGNTSMQLSDLMAKLGVEGFDVSKVESVSFTDESLVKIEKSGDDWTLTSLQPFNSQEELTVTMEDGTVYKIGVTDKIETADKDKATDFSNYISDVTVKKLIDGEWKVPEDNKFVDGDQVNATINFNIPAGVVTAEYPTIVYQLPNGIKPVAATSGTAYRGNTPVGTFEVDTDGKIYIKYNPEFATGDAFTGDLSFKGTVSRNEAGQGGEIVFPGNGGTITVEPGSTQYDMTLNKKASTIDKTDSNNWKANYTVTAYSYRGTDPDQKISITDKINGQSTATGTYDQSSFNLYKIVLNDDGTVKSKTEVSANPTFADGGFSYSNLDPLGKNEEYQVAYTMTDIQKKTEGGNADGSSQLINDAGATSGDVKPKTQNTLEVTKASVAKSGWYDASKRSIQWTITLNQGRDVIKADTEFSDTLPVELDLSKLPTDDDGPYVELKDSDDSSKTVRLYVGSDRRIYYKFTSDSNHQYTITYYTPVDENLISTDRNVTNTATLGGNSSGGTVNVPENEWSVSKSFIKDDQNTSNNTYHWQTSVNVKNPITRDGGFTFEDTITGDTVDGHTVGHYGHYWTLKTQLDEKLGSNVVILDSDGKNVTDQCNFEIKYYDKDGKEITNGGGGDGNYVSRFTIKVTSKTDTPVDATTFTINDYTTYNSTSEAEKGKTYVMKNKASVEGKTSEASHDFLIPVPMKKYVQTAGKNTTPSDNVNKYSAGDVVLNYEDAIITKDGKHVLTYVVLVDPLSMNADDTAITLTDTLPAGTSLLDGSLHFYVSKSSNLTNLDDHIYQWYLPGTDFTFGSESTVSKGTVTATKNGQTLTININANDAEHNVNLYKDAQNRKTDQIMIRYQVVLDDAFTNAKLEKGEFTNSISWTGVGTVSQTTQVDRNYKKVRKTGYQRKDSDGNPTNYIDYNIIVNAKGENLSSATDTITLEDSMSRKNVWGESNATADLDLTSVKAYHYDPTKTNGIGNPLDNDLYTIQYDDSDSTGKRVTNMVLPDEVPLIVTYTYKINRESDLEKTTFDNTISLNGKTADSTETKLVETSGSSNASRQYVTLYKIDSQTYKLLDGATFKIEKWNKTAGKWETVAGYDDYSLKDSNGNWQNVLGPDDSDTFQTDILYRISEVNPPAGYAQTNTKYYFLFNGKDSNKSEENDNTAKYNAGAWDSGVSSDDKNYKADAVHCITSKGGTVQIENDSTGINVKKVWLDKDGNEFTPTTGSVTVQLVKHTKKDIVSYGHTVRVKYMSHEQNSYQIGNIDSYTVADNGYMYITLPRGGTKPVDFTYNGKIETFSTDNDSAKMVTIGPFTGDTDVVIRCTTDNWGASQYTIVCDAAGWGFAENSGTPEGNQVTLNSANSWKYAWETLPKKDNDGNPIYYEIKEVGSTDGYTTSYTHNGISSGTITVTNREKPTKSFSFTKKWEDENGTDLTKWPDGKTITVRLTGGPFAYTFSISGYTVKRTDNNGGNVRISKAEGTDFTYVIEGLPYDYTYTLTESAPSDNSFEISYEGDGTSITTGKTITNKEKPTPTEFTFTKEWYSSAGTTPETEWQGDIVVTLKKNAEDAGTKYTIHKDGDNFTATPEGGEALSSDDFEATAGTDGKFAFTFKNLESKDSSGNDYTYSIVESKVSEYYQEPKYTDKDGHEVTGSVSDSGTVKNVHVPATFEFTKAWDNGNDNTSWGKKDGQDIELTFTLTGKKDNTEVYHFTVNAKPGDSSRAITQSADDVNKLTSAPTVTVGSDGSISINGLPSGYDYSLTETKGDNLSDYKDPEYEDANGNALDPQAEGITSGQKIKNTKETTSYSFKKMWQESDGTPSTDWEDITVTLKATANGQETASTYVISKNEDGSLIAKKDDVALSADKFTGSTGENGQYNFEFKNLPKSDSNGYVYTYTLTEQKINDTYEDPKYADKDGKEVTGDNAAAPNEGIVTNKKTTVPFNFTKVWSNGTDATWPTDTSATFHLKGTRGDSEINFTIVASSGSGAPTVTADTGTSVDPLPAAAVSGQYAIAITGLPSGYEYSLTEDKVSGYNDPAYSVQTTVDENGTANGIKDGGTITNTKLESFEFEKQWLNANGTPKTNWQKDITVTLTGTKLGEDGTTENIAEKFTIHKEENGNYTAAPAEVTGENPIIDYQFVPEVDDNTFKFRFDNLPAGYTYSLTEDTVEGYGEPEYVEATDSSVFTVKNTELATFNFNKIWKGQFSEDPEEWHKDGEAYTELTFTVTGKKGNANDLIFTIKAKPGENGISVEAPEGVTAPTVELTDNSHQYSINLTGLPSGYTYTVKETTQVTGYDKPDYGEGKEAAENNGIITNKQTATYSLPATGGPGPIRYIGGGLLLMLLALLLIYKNTHERRKGLS